MEVRIRPIPKQHDGKYYTDFDHTNGHETLVAARTSAANAQAQGKIRRSVQIFRNGQLVDYKRY